MRYLIMIATLALGSSFALASDPGRAASMEKKIFGKHEVKFDCTFGSHKKKGVQCTAKGEVCVDFGRPVAAVTEDGCDNDKDDNRLRIECTDGFTDNDKATGKINKAGDPDWDLVIASTDDTIEVEDFKKFDGDNDKDDTLPASLHAKNEGKFWGQCVLRLER